MLAIVPFSAINQEISRFVSSPAQYEDVCSRSREHICG
jgi:hypothetical protein